MNKLFSKHSSIFEDTPPSPFVHHKLSSAASKTSPQQSDDDAAASSDKVLTLGSLSRQLVEVEYPVRGAIAILAAELTRQLEAHPERFSKFHEVVPANTGNPQALGRQPITFNRQVLACLLNPTLLEESDHGKASNFYQTCFPFPEDVKSRCVRYLKSFPAIGAYSESKGVALFRRDIAAWFERRDGFECDPDSIYLADGASAAILYSLELLISDCSSGILIPTPQYPLYSATITRLGGTAVPYFLEEENGWRLPFAELQRAVEEARSKDINCKALVVINPNNPTGSLLREEEEIDIIRFCEKEKLVIMADEVYQDNIFSEAKFVSFRKLVKTLKSKVELISFHSASKSFAGECGMRGGLMQLENIDPAVAAVLVKLLSISLCPNTMGQAMLVCTLNPPLPGEASYELYNKEATEVHSSLKERALYATKKLNEIEGISCQPIESSLYAFPSINIPAKAVEAAKEKGVAPDMLYCMEMLTETGVVCVPGSGFHQRAGTHHFRLTILPSNLKSMLEAIQKFHIGFLQKYSAADGVENGVIRHKL